MIENDEKVKLQPKKVITCPHCKWQYLPGEILYGDNVVGVPTQIVRDALGHVIYEEYKTKCNFWFSHRNYHHAMGIRM